MENVLIILAILLLAACQVSNLEFQLESAQLSPESTSSNLLLFSGTPPYADPSPIIYKGEVKLEGEIVYKEKYVGDLTPHFRVAEESLKNLPPHLSHRDFTLTTYYEDNSKIIPATTEVIDKIKSEGELASIMVDQLVIYFEGSPSLNLINF
jgi:hypothetical protein